MNKKIVFLIFLLLCIFSLASCGTIKINEESDKVEEIIIVDETTENNSQEADSTKEMDTVETTEILEEYQGASILDNSNEVMEDFPTNDNVEEAKARLFDYIPESYEITYLPNFTREKNLENHYCFLLEYSSVLEIDNKIYAYAFVSDNMEQVLFKEGGQCEPKIDSLYGNMPDEYFPIPTIDGSIVEYEGFEPPGYFGTYYWFKDEKTIEVYKTLLKEKGFVDYGTVQSVESLWVYERDEDNATLIVEINGVSVSLYVNYLR